MSAAPRLLAGRRRASASALAALALSEAGLAVLFAATLDWLLSHQGTPIFPVLAAAATAGLGAIVLFLTRRVGEGFAQGFVMDCRAALFGAVTRSRGTGHDARWLTCLINDMAALRNYALRGTVRLWTSALAAGAAAGWVLIAMPPQRLALIPLLLGAMAMGLLTVPLHRAITAQRSQRGRLNRFLVRRVRAELAGEPVTKGHGFRKLERLSGELARLSVRRAGGAGAMDALASAAGLAAALALVWQAQGNAQQAGLAGSLTLFGFIAARLLETGRALHARIAGRIALARLEARLRTAPQAPAGRARPAPARHRFLRRRPQTLPTPATASPPQTFTKQTLTKEQDQ